MNIQLCCALLLLGPLSLAAQEPAPTPLTVLLREAEAHNPEIRAAEARWHAAQLRPAQAAALPDPEIQFANMSVGGPLPLTGQADSMMAFTGVGVAETFPFPGKRRLRGQIAATQAASAGLQIGATRRQVAVEVKAAYFEIAGLQQTVRVLTWDQKLLEIVAQAAASRFSVGEGSQADVLRVQLRQTRLQAEITQQSRRRETAEASLKRWLNRPFDSDDIIATQLQATPLPSGSAALSASVEHNPALLAQAQATQSRRLAVALAKRDFFPDLHVSYMLEATGPSFPYRSELSVSVGLPLFWVHKQRSAVEEARQETTAAQAAYDDQRAGLHAEARQWTLQAAADEHLLTIYNDGLLPQSAAAWEAGLAAYRNGQADLQSLLSTLLDWQDLREEYWRTLADHEIAVARLEAITGPWPDAGSRAAALRGPRVWSGAGPSVPPPGIGDTPGPASIQGSGGRP